MRKTSNPSTAVRHDAELVRPLTKTLFKLASECPTKLYYAGKPKEYADDSLDDSFLRNLAKGGFQVGALAKHHFAGGIEVEGLGYAAQLAETQRLLEAPSVVLFEAAFRFGNCFVRADVVEKDGATLRFYEVKAKSIDSDSDTFWQPSKPDQINTKWKSKLIDVAFQQYVISRARPDLQVVPYLMLVDKAKRASIDGLNQKFRLQKRGTRETVPHNSHLKSHDLGEFHLGRLGCNARGTGYPVGARKREIAPRFGPLAFPIRSGWKKLADAVARDERIPARVNRACKDCQFNVTDELRQNLKSGFEECWMAALRMTREQLASRIPVFQIWKLSQGDLVETGTTFVDQLQESDLYPKKPAKTTQRFVGWRPAKNSMGADPIQNRGPLLRQGAVSG